MLRWKLKEYLDANSITPYRLMQESGISGNTIYRLANNRTDGVQGKVLNQIMNTLQKITGEAITPNDLLEFLPDVDHA